MKLFIGPEMVLGNFLYISVGIVLGYFLPLPIPSNIEPLDARGKIASYKKVIIKVFDIFIIQSSKLFCL